MKIGPYEFPDTCPDECSIGKNPHGQGGLCHRCPIFNCVGEDRLLEPEDYRLDWAGIWNDFFNAKEKEARVPKLKL